MRRYGALFLLITLFWTNPASASRKEESLRLENGLRITLRPVLGSVNTSVVVVYSIGGNHDPAGRSGLAHLVEHVYVTAACSETKARTINEFAERYGRGWNAQTGDTYTVIATNVTTAELILELEDAAARMTSLEVTEGDLKREKPRLIAELSNMFGGIPALAAMNFARETLMPTPSGGRKGGLPDEVEAIELGVIRNRIDTYYKPRNAHVILAGGFDVELVRQKVKELFGPIAPGEEIGAAPGEGPPLDEEIRFVEAVPAQPELPSEACVAYRAPLPGDSLYAPFLVLAARIWTELQGSQPSPKHYIVSYSFLDDPKALYVRGNLQDPELPTATVDNMTKMLESVTWRRLQDSDIDMALNAFGFLLDLMVIGDDMLARNLYGVAFSIARRAQLGVDSERVRREIENVTEVEIQAAALRYLGIENRRAVIVFATGGRSE